METMNTNLDRRTFLGRLPVLAAAAGLAGLPSVVAATKRYDPVGPTLGNMPYFGQRKAVYSADFTALWYQPSKFVLDDNRVRVHFLESVRVVNGQLIGKPDRSPTLLGVARVEAEEQKSWMQVNPMGLPMLINVQWQVYYSRRLSFQPTGRVIGPKAGFLVDTPGVGRMSWAYVNDQGWPQPRTLPGFVLCYTSHGLWIHPMPDMPPNKSPFRPCKAQG